MTARMNAYRVAVVAAIKQKMPSLKECEEQFGRFDLDELETRSVKAPAVRIAILSADISAEPSANADALLNCAAFIITEGKDRDAESWTIAEAISTMLHSGQMWGLTRISAPSKVKVKPALSMSRQQRVGIVLMSIEWQQTLRGLGTSIFDDDGVVLEELYVNGEEVSDA